MKNIMTKKQSEALTNFGVEHDKQWSMKVASDLLRLAIYTAGTRRTDYKGYVVSNATFNALRKRTVGQEMTRDEVALVYLWIHKVDQDIEEDIARFGSRLDEWI